MATVSQETIGRSQNSKPKLAAVTSDADTLITRLNTYTQDSNFRHDNDHGSFSFIKKKKLSAIGKLHYQETR